MIAISVLNKKAWAEQMLWHCGSPRKKRLIVRLANIHQNILLVNSPDGVKLLLE
jgi:hypothetical protein